MSASAGELRDQARDILSGREYSESELPRPFEGPLRWLGDRLEPIGDWFSDTFDSIAATLPGGRAALWALIGIAIIGAVFWLARGSIRRREALGEERALARAGAAHEDPRALEQAADAAERAGDYERAVRLRFRAGVLRLGAGAVIANPESATTGALATLLGAAAFEPLGRSFDEITYGGRAAGAADAEVARVRWPEVLDAARGSARTSRGGARAQDEPAGVR